ncbi:MAG: hypothetical protein RL226_1242 [Bacteroidota bacterium]|jgi:cell division protein FtsB
MQKHQGSLMREMNHLCNMKKKIIRFLKGRYGVTLGVFVVWMMFFNDVDLIFIAESYGELKSMEREIKYFEGENEIIREALDDLSNNASSLEKFAREEYFMKKPNEDLFVIRVVEK